MDIAVIGTGKIGRTLGEALAAAGHEIRYGSRTPEDSVREALDGAEAVIVGIPGQYVADFARGHADELAGKVVIDAANKFGEGPAHSAAEFAILAPAARYARAFNALGWENFADPVFDGVVADLFYSADEADRETVERLIRDTGLNAVYLGPGQHDLLDQLLKLWFTLANGQGPRQASGLQGPLTGVTAPVPSRPARSKARQRQRVPASTTREVHWRGAGSSRADPDHASDRP